MRVYLRKIQTGTFGAGGAGAFAEATPDVAPVADIRDTGGGTVQAGLTATYDATRDRWHFDTTNLLYANATVYFVYRTVVLAGTSYADPAIDPQPYVHYTPTTADITGPGAPGIGTPEMTDTTATFPTTPPPDADYATTIIYGVAPDGTIVQGTGGVGDTTITVTGLAPGTTYHWFAIAFDDAGNPSLPGPDCFGIVSSTLPLELPDHPFWVKTYVDGETGVHAYGPYPCDAEAVPSYPGGSVIHSIGGGPGPGLGRGHSMRIRVECHGSKCPEVLNVGLLAEAPTMRPHGTSGPYRSP